MKVIIAGSRIITNYKAVLCAIDNSGFEITEVISGGALGVDRLGEKYAKENEICLRIVFAKWKKYGKRAGYLRNRAMAEIGDALIAVWDGSSRGTKNMIDEMRVLKKPIYIHKTY